MTKLRFSIPMSLDGYVAGPNQSATDRSAREELHKWLFALRRFRAIHGLEGGATGPDDDIAAEYFQNIAETMPPNNAINSDSQERRFALPLAAGYGQR